MAYFGVDPKRYGGWSADQRAEALKNAELPPERDPRESDDDGREQTDIRRWIAHIDQANRMFRSDESGEYERLIELPSDEELDALLSKIDDEE